MATIHVRGFIPLTLEREIILTQEESRAFAEQFTRNLSDPLRYCRLRLPQNQPQHGPNLSAPQPWRKLSV